MTDKEEKALLSQKGTNWVDLVFDTGEQRDGYQIDLNSGKVLSHKGLLPRVRKATQSSSGYLMMSFGQPGKKTTVPHMQYVHRMVWASAHGRSIPEGMQCHHIDCDPQNNSIDNLQIVSVSEHAMFHGRERAIKEDNQVERIRALRLDGMSYRKIARLFDVSAPTIRRVVLGIGPYGGAK